jgi:valyl-tRNA synthetase
MEAARNFANKIWNATRFVLMNCENVTEGEWIDTSSAPATLADKWILSRLHSAIRDFNSSLTSFRYHDAANHLYHFFWDDFCDWYIELSKPLVTTKGESAAADGARQRIIFVLEHSLRLLHPIMPYITEELWQQLPHDDDSICIAPFPEVVDDLIRSDIESDMDSIIEIIKKIRNIRAEWNIAPSQTVRVLIGTHDDHIRKLVESNDSHIERLAKVEAIELHQNLPQVSAAARAVVSNIEIAVPLEGMIDFAKERDRIKRDMEKSEKELGGLRGRLNNPSFIDRAAPEVVEQTRERAAELEVQLAKLVQTLGFLQ